MISPDVAQLSDRGLIRDENQDDYCWKEDSTGQKHLFLVADGVGGEVGGRAAARMATEIIPEDFFRALQTQLPTESLQAAIESANAKIHAKGTSGDPAYNKMGTTIVALFVENMKAYTAHAGDSRVYLFRNGDLVQVTKDHSRVQQMVDSGIITKEQAENHPDSNIITRSLGSRPEVEVELQQPIDILPGDIFLLCTDGLSGLVNDAAIQNLLSQDAPLNDKVKYLIESAKTNGGHDNITAQLISFSAKTVASNMRDASCSRPEGKKQGKKTLLLTVVVAIVAILAAAAAFLTRSPAPTKGPAAVKEQQVAPPVPQQPQENKPPAPAVVVPPVAESKPAVKEKEVPNKQAKHAAKIVKKQNKAAVKPAPSNNKVQLTQPAVEKAVNPAEVKKATSPAVNGVTVDERY